MAQETHTPTAQGTYNQWTLLGGGAKWSNMSDSNDATGGYDTDDHGIDCYAFSDFVATGIAVVNWLKINHRSKEETNNWGYTAFFRSGGVDEFDTEIALTINLANYTSSAFTTDPSSNPWTSTTVNAAECGGRFHKLGAGGNARTVEMSVTSDYCLAAGGCSYMLANWIPPLLAITSGAGLLVREIAGGLKALKIRPSNREEFELIKHELLRRPVYGYT